MKNGLTIALLLLIASPTAAQFSPTPFSARSQSLGGAHVPVQAQRYLMLDYRQGYAMAGMATRSIAAGWTLGRHGQLAGEYRHFGDPAYHEQQAAAGYGLAVSRWLTLGVGGRYCRLATNDAHYEPQRWLALEGRMQAAPSDRLTLYASGGTRPWDADKRWAARIGTAWRPVEGLLTVVEADSDERLRIRGGVEYCYRSHYFIRAGMATAPTTLTFGLGLRRSFYAIDLAIESHEHLGITPQITLALCP